MPKRPSELVFASAGEAARAIRTGNVSSVQLTKHILERIDRYNPSLNAVITILKDEALVRAYAADKGCRMDYCGVLCMEFHVPSRIPSKWRASGLPQVHSH